MHTGVVGAEMNDGIYDSEGYPLEALSHFKLVISGHYHKRQVLGNVHYIGSPYETRADEAWQPKGFAILEDDKLTYHDRVWGPRHIGITLQPDATEGDIRAHLADYKDDILRVEVPAGTDPETVGRTLVEAGFQNHVVTPQAQESSAARLSVGTGASLREYARAYAELKRPEAVEPLMAEYDVLAGVVR
jgi:DNA repair exonuclease SbcCD nuclease subunit